MAFSAAVTLALIAYFLSRAGVAVAAVSDPTSPDAISGSSSVSLDGGLSSNSSSSAFIATSSNISAVSASSATTPLPPPMDPTTVSSPKQAPVARMTQSNTVSMSGTLSGSSSVPYDAKSMDNPYFVSFLEDFAMQSGQRLQDLQAVALVDPQIDLLWEVFAQTFAGGATLPAISGGGSTSSGSTSVGGSTVMQYSGGDQRSGASAEPTINNNWFQSFFKDPALSSPTGISYQQPTPTSSSRSSSGSSMDQTLSSFFRSPSISQQQQYPQQSSTNLAQSLLNMMTQSLRSGSQQYSPQSGTSVPSGQAGTLPDSGWNTGPQPPHKDPLSNVTSDQLTNELLLLLGKQPSPTPTSTSSQKAQPPPPPTPSPTPKAAAATQAPPQGQTQPPIFNSQINNSPTLSTQQTAAMATSNTLSTMMNFGSQTSPIGLTGLPEPVPTQQPFFDTLSQASGMNMLAPIARFYNAGFDTKASRDLGCRTLGEMLDMDVPRAMDFTCQQSCSSIMAGTFTGKRFGLTCLCCPAYVSDHAIGMRSMYWRAEALT